MRLITAYQFILFKIFVKKIKKLQWMMVQLKYFIMPQEQLKTFFSFLNGKAEKTPLTDKLNAMVKRAKLNVQWRRKFMTWEQELQIREKQSFAEGKEQGIKTGKLSIAKTMLEKQFSINDIIMCTGLTEEQIKELK